MERLIYSSPLSPQAPPPPPPCLRPSPPPPLLHAATPWPVTRLPPAVLVVHFGYVSENFPFGAAVIISVLVSLLIQPFLASQASATIQSASRAGGPSVASIGGRLICAEVFSSAWTGFFAGCLHTLSGPDHLAALATLSIGRSSLQSTALGALWGCGHDAGQVMFGFLFLTLKRSVAYGSAQNMWYNSSTDDPICHWCHGNLRSNGDSNTMLLDPILTSLPEELTQLTALQQLIIRNCPKLSGRCWVRGELRPKIAHIPLIRIDGHDMPSA